MATARADSCGAGLGNEQNDGRCDETPETSSGKPLENNAEPKPVCLIVLGMAGSGKTTFVQVKTSMVLSHLYYDRFLLLCPDWLQVHNQARAEHQGVADCLVTLLLANRSSEGAGFVRIRAGEKCE